MFLVSTGENIFRLIVVIVVFLGVLAITVFATRWMANYQKKIIDNSNFEVIDTLSVGSSQRLMIIKAAKKYFIIGVGKEEISYLCELNEEELSFPHRNEQATGRDFSEILDRFAKNFHSQK